MGYYDILGVSEVPHERSLWIWLYRGSEQVNSIVDRGPRACVGHALQVPMAGTSVPVGELIL